MMGRHTGWRRTALALAMLVPAVGRAQQNGVTDGEVVFGMSAPFSGTAKEYGRQLRLGLEVAFAAVNEAGGINGRKLRLVPMDDAYEVPRARTAIRELIERHKVFGIAAAFGTASVEAVLPYVIEKGVFYSGALTGATALRNDPPDRYVFNFRPGYTEEITAIVKYLVEVRRVKPNQIAAFLQDDGAGESGWVGIARQMRKYKRDPASVIRVGYRRNTVDVEAAVKTIRQKARQVRAVVMLGNYRPCAKFIEKLRSAGLNLVFATVSVVSPNELAEQLVAVNPAYAEGVVVTQVVPAPSSAGSGIIRYRQALQRYAPDERPDYVSLESWINGNIIAEALRRVGRNFTTETFIDALESVRGFDLGLGTIINYGPSEHQGSHKVWGTVLDSRGAYRQVELE